MADFKYRLKHEFRGVIQPQGCNYTPEEVGRILGNRVVQPHYAAWLVRKAIENAQHMAENQTVQKPDNSLWASARQGFTSGIRAFRAGFKFLFIWLPCILCLSLPAYLVGYAWRWIVGGFRAGELGFHNTKGTGVETWRMEIQVKEAGK